MNDQNFGHCEASSSDGLHDRAEEIGVELDRSDATVPDWQTPEIVEPFLEDGSQSERKVVERFLHSRYLMHGALDRLVRLDSSAESAVEVASLAFNHLDVCLKLARSLAEWRARRLGKTIKISISGPSVALGAKIEDMLRPGGSPARHLIVGLQDISEDLEDVAARLTRKARGLRAHIGDYAYCERAKIFGQSVPSSQECMRWERLATKVHSKSAEVTCLALDLEAAKVNVVVVCRPERVRQRPTMSDSGFVADRRHDAA